MSDVERTGSRLTRADFTVITAQCTLPRSFQKTYDYCFSINAINDLDKARENPSYISVSVFEEWRHEASLDIRRDNMVRHLAQEGVTDYKIVRTPKSIDFHFTSQWECNIAKMAYLKEQKYLIEIAPPDGDIPFKQARKYLHRLREDFSRTERGYSIKFRLDRENRHISAICPNRRAYVDFMGNDYAIPTPKF